MRFRNRQINNSWFGVMKERDPKPTMIKVEIIRKIRLELK